MSTIHKRKHDDKDVNKNTNSKRAKIESTSLPEVGRQRADLLNNIVKYPQIFPKKLIATYLDDSGFIRDLALIVIEYLEIKITNKMLVILLTNYNFMFCLDDNNTNEKNMVGKFNLQDFWAINNKNTYSLNNIDVECLLLLEFIKIIPQFLLTQHWFELTDDHRTMLFAPLCNTKSVHFKFYIDAKPQKYFIHSLTTDTVKDEFTVLNLVTNLQEVSYERNVLIHDLTVISYTENGLKIEVLCNYRKRGKK